MGKNQNLTWWQNLKLYYKEKPEVFLAPLVFLITIFSWEFVVKSFDIPKIILPAPSLIITSLVNLFKSGNLLYHIWITVLETVAGFFIGSVLGLVLGILIAQFPLVERTIYPFMVAFQSIPKIAIAPIIIIWAGYGIESKIIITALISFFPLMVNTVAGLQATSEEYSNMLISFTASKWQIFKIVKFPMALPFIFAGLNMAGVMSVIGAIVGEFVGAKAGLGYLILHRQFQLDMPGVFAILLILSLMGISIHLIITGLQKRIVFWE
jgi:NitT/TauT family transport system permease protein